MIPEEEYKNRLLAKLNNQHKGWVDGDTESHLTKTADIVNHELEMAIEIKDDLQFELQASNSGAMVVQSVNLTTKSNQFKSDARDANKKFRNYRRYKSLLLIRSEFAGIATDYILSGISQYIRPANSDMILHRKRNKYLSTKNSEIGGYLFVHDKYYYFPNPVGGKKRKISIEELKGLLQSEVEVTKM
jgi:uncharacterized protein YeeX (DUF496 family)